MCTRLPIRFINFLKRISRSKSIFRELVLKLYQLLPNTFPRIRFRCKFYRMYLSTGSIARFRFSQGKDLDDEEETLLVLLARGGCCVDVGANCGTITLALAIRGKCRVLSIEANPQSYLELQENIRLNRVEEKVWALNVAATNTDNLALYIEDNWNYDTCNRIVPSPSFENRTQDFGDYSNRPKKVNGRSLDSIDLELKLPEVINLLKIDIEGHELKAMEGASSVLSKTRIVYFEYWDSLASNYGYNLKDILILLKGHGFNIITCPVVRGDTLDWTDCFSINQETSGQKLEYYIAINTTLD
jgi:FkbM family methyltransferase